MKTFNIRVFRKSTLTLLFCLCLGLLASCGGNSEDGGGGNAEYTAKEIADAIIEAYDSEDLPNMKKYISGVPSDSEFYLEPEYAGVLINGNYSAVEEMAYVEDYAFYTPIGHRVFEVDVILADSAEFLVHIQGMMGERLKKKDDGDIRLYNPAEVPLIENSVIVTVDRYVILLATTDNDKAQSVISEMFSGGTVKLDKNEPSSTATDSPDSEYTAQEGAGEIESGGIEIVGDNIAAIKPNIILDFDKLALTPPKGLPFSEQTAVPNITISKYSHNDMYLIGGNCEQGSVITVTGGTEEIVSKSDFGDYLVEIPIEEGTPSVLKLTAKVEGKESSDEITIIVRQQKNVFIFEERGIYGTIVGRDYQCVFNDGVPDYEGTNLLSSEELTALTDRTIKKINELKAAGADSEIIYLLVPNPMEIYSELMPSKYIRHEGESLTDQFTKAVTAGGASVIDLTDVMMEHKNDEFKTYHKTDSHWTEYGALLGYTELMNHIAKKFPDAAPRPMTDFTIFNKQMLLGDIYYMIELPNTCLTETTAFVDFNFEAPTGDPHIYNGNNLSIDHEVVGKAHKTNTNQTGNFPSAYLFRDSFGGPIYSFLTDRFATATWNAWGQYNFNAKQIAASNPDYVIYIITERNIKNILY